MITYKQVREYFIYTPTTGLLVWKKQKGASKAGTLAGSYSKGHLFVNLNYKRYPVTHIIWLYQFGKLPKTSIDHINRIRDDNRLINLREATFKDQQGNKKTYKNNVSGIRGVSFRKDRNKWRARLNKMGKQYHLGVFNSKQEAEKVYLKAAKEYFGEFYNDTNSQ